MVTLQRAHLLAHLLLGNRLQAPVQGRDHGQTTGLQELIPVCLLQLGCHPVDEVGCLDVFLGGSRLEQGFLGECGGRLRLGQIVRLDHGVENQSLAGARPVEVAVGIEL